jgi:hypothetical protein
MARSIPPGSPAAATALSTYSRNSASPSATATPDTRRPRARSSVSHQTLKRWLAAQPPAADLPTLQRQLDQFRVLYNTTRIHRAHGRTPADAYARTVKAAPPCGQNQTPGPYRVRVDVIDRHGKISLRRAGRMHHLGIGATHAGTPTLILVHPDTVEVINPATGEHLSSHTIDPNRDYWRNTQRNPGRWPRSP